MQKILLTVTEAAYSVNYSTAAIYKLINSGKLPYVKKGKNYLIPLLDNEPAIAITSRIKDVVMFCNCIFVIVLDNCWNNIT